MKRKIILDLCGGTGSWSQPYKDAGYFVIVITLPKYDITLTEITKDFITFKNADKDSNVCVVRRSAIQGILAAPPCTHFTNSGAQYWKAKDKDERTIADTKIIAACLHVIAMVKPKWWAFENPTGRMGQWMGKPQLVFNPCDFGDAYTKRTCLWGNFTVPEYNKVEPVFVIAKNGDRYSPVHWGTGGTSAKTKEKRSVTPPGFAKAFFKTNQ